MEQPVIKPMVSDRYLLATPILDYDDPIIRELVMEKGWRNLEEEGRIRSIYNYVRDEIPFGYNSADNLPASRILRDGYGQCNTKAVLFMALLRAVGIPNRIHGFTIDKALQKGAVTGIWYRLSPKNILHSWVEVYFEGKWYNLEGLILDTHYLNALQQKFPDCETTFCGYGAFTDNFRDPQVSWERNHTYIQDKGINQDFGLFENPDEFFNKHKQEMGMVKRLVYRIFVRHLMNRNIRKIREQ